MILAHLCWCTTIWKMSAAMFFNSSCSVFHDPIYKVQCNPHFRLCWGAINLTLNRGIFYKEITDFWSLKPDIKWEKLWSRTLNEGFTVHFKAYNSHCRVIKHAYTFVCMIHTFFQNVAESMRCWSYVISFIHSKLYEKICTAKTQNQRDAFIP